MYRGPAHRRAPSFSARTHPGRYRLGRTGALRSGASRDRSGASSWMATGSARRVLPRRKQQGGASPAMSIPSLRRTDETVVALAPRPAPSETVRGSALRGLSFVAATLTIIGGRPAVAARVPAVRGRALPVVGSVGAHLDGHLRLILCKRISYCGAQITPGGRLVARLGGAVAFVRSPVVLIPFARGRHRGSLARANERPRPSWRTRGCLQAQCAGH